MGLGDSAGRSRRNPTGQGAIRRATPRQRQLVDPPTDSMTTVPIEDTTPSNQEVALVTGWAMTIFFAIFGIVLLLTNQSPQAEAVGALFVVLSLLLKGSRATTRE